MGERSAWMQKDMRERRGDDVLTKVKTFVEGLDPLWIALCFLMAVFMTGCLFGTVIGAR